MEAAIFHGTLPFIIDPPAVSRGGRGMLDSFKARLLCADPWETDARTLGFEIDKKLTGYHSLWIRSMTPDYEAEGLVTVDVTGEGLSTAGDRRQRKITCGEYSTSVGPLEEVVLVWNKEEQGQDPETGEKLDRVRRREPRLDEYGEPVLKNIGTPSGTAKMWLVWEAEVTVMDTYFVTEKPVMNTVGTVVAPPNAPTVPAYSWGGYSEELRFNHPNGWILSDRDVEELFYQSDTIGLWRVTDTHVFRQTGSPG